MARTARTAEQIQADGASPNSAAQQAQIEAWRAGHDGRTIQEAIDADQIDAYAADGFMTASPPVAVQSTDLTGARCFDTQPHASHRIIGSWRGSCQGIEAPQAPAATPAVPCGICGGQHDDQDCTIDVPAPGEPGYTSCPRQCGTDVRAHRSTDLVDGGCDIGEDG